MTGNRRWFCDLWLGPGRATGVLCLAVTCAALGLPGLAHAARKALVIGNDKYDSLRPLRNSAQDARDVAQALRDAGFEVPEKWVLQNARRRDMGNALQDFLARIAEGDEVVFFYSGHGVEIDGQAALVPVDLPDVARRPLDGSLRPLTEVDLAKRQVLDESLTVNRVATEIAQRGARFSLLIIDACRDNPVLDYLRQAHAASPTKNAGPPPMTGLIADQAADTQVLLFSAGRGQQALDRLSDSDPVRNSVFTRVLLRHMRTPGLGLRAMLPLVKIDVKSLTASVRSNGRPHVQEPKSMAAYDAPDFVFRPPAVPVTAPLPAPAPAREQAPAPVAAPAPSQPPAPGPADLQVFRDCADCPEMVVIPAGRFLIGSPAGEPERDANEGPQREVRVNRFALGKYEVTQGEWKAVMGSDPSIFASCGDECPVEGVSWNDALEYVRRLSQRTGQRYRLPSEAEWEYAARAGTMTPFHTGQSITTEQANFDGNSTYNGNGKGEYRQRTMRVGSFAPNAFGLFDMHGNVWEWVQDCYDKEAYRGKTPGNGSAYEVAGCSVRALRGGAWSNYPAMVRSAVRSGVSADSSGGNSGFRLARMLP